MFCVSVCVCAILCIIKIDLSIFFCYCCLPPFHQHTIQVVFLLLCVRLCSFHSLFVFNVNNSSFFPIKRFRFFLSVQTSIFFLMLSTCYQGEQNRTREEEEENHKKATLKKKHKKKGKKI